MTLFENWVWSYDAALAWLQAAKEACIERGDMAIGVGVHDAPLITLGRHASEDELFDAAYLRHHNISVYHIDRGGGATFHGPGQIVLYPVVDLKILQLSIPDFIRALETIMIGTLATFHIDAQTIEGEPGVFIDGAKIGAVGLRVSQGIITHGLSLNVSNNLDAYSHFRPCKKDNARVTSMATLGVNADVVTVGKALTRSLCARIQVSR